MRCGERAVDRRDHTGGHAGVAGRRLQLVVTQERLDDPDVDPAFEQMGGKGVAQGMQAHGLGPTSAVVLRIEL